MQEARILAVAAAELIARFVAERGAPLCKDQLLRMLTLAVLVTAKYWDEGQAMNARLNAKLAQRAGIPLGDVNLLEVELLPPPLSFPLLTGQVSSPPPP